MRRHIYFSKIISLLINIFIKGKRKPFSLVFLEKTKYSPKKEQ